MNFSPPFVLKMLLRDWRSGELRILIAALIVAVSTVAGIGLFSDRIQATIVFEAGTLLAADRAVSGSKEIPKEWVDKAYENNLEVGFITSFQGMVLHDENLQLSSVKAVSDTYPLKGLVKISDVPFSTSVEVNHGPSPGNIWLISRLFSVLDLKIGDKVQLGETFLTVNKVLVSEPDSAGAFFGVQPKVMIHQDDVAAINAVQRGSRVNYTLLLAGSLADLEVMDDWLEPIIKENEHFRSRGASQGQGNVAGALERAESFLLLAGCLAVILAAVAVALASQRYATRQIKVVALLKTLGLKPNQISRIYILNLLMIALVGISIGLIIGWGLHLIVLSWLSDFFPAQVEMASFKPVITALITGGICLAAFAYPPIHALRNIMPSRILQAQVSGELTNRGSTWLSGFIAVIILVWWYSNSITLTLALVVGTSIALLLVLFIGLKLINFANAIGRRRGSLWRIGLANLKRHKRHNAMQLMVFGLAFMLLFILILLRTSLITEWQKTVPDDAPNHFLFNIFEDELDSVNTWREVNNIPQTQTWPMMRGRISKVNDEALADRVSEGERGNEYRRELNMTWELQQNTQQVVEGSAWSDKSSDELLVSLEQEWATTIGVEIGDILTISVGGLPMTAKVENFRAVEWESLQPNFYIVFNQALLGGGGATWITSFYLDADSKGSLGELLRQSPTLSLVEIDAIIKQIQSIVSKVSLAVEFILALVLLAGGLTLIAGIFATLDIRIQESAVMRALGASRKLVSGVLIIEFGMLGLLAGLIGLTGAELSLWYLQTQLFELPFTPHYSLWIFAPLSGMFIIGGLGWLTTRHVSSTPPLNVLREV